MPAQSPQELLLTELQAIRSAEEQVSQLLPKHAERVQAEQLRPLLDERLQRGERLLQQLEQGL
ncbi:MAG: ferritin-like domain-containing protein, partial [Proteobacteria bacterium]|nr:ferritin-like domain-containing protein [Pseudomonadota bacterium]